MLDEAATLPALLAHLAHWREQGCEVVLVDGGSTDASVALATSSGFRVLSAARGRARQMNAGAQAAQGSSLLFLHADTRLPDAAQAEVLNALSRPDGVWGRFDVRIEGRSLLLPVVAALMNLRSRLSGIATGDQAMFMRREIFDVAGGFPDQALMEDIEMSSRLRRYARPVCLRARVTTSGRRWDQRGVWRTILLMWRLRWAYWRGVPADVLEKAYR
jgi:rSAM/selenodomain-associated transferase 2